MKTKGERSCRPCQLHRSVCVQMGLATVAGRAGRASKSMELCNKEVAQSPSHQGRLAVRGRARFSTRSSSHYTNAFMGGLQPHKIPSRETTPALPDSESYPGMEASLLLGRFSMPRTHICAPGHMVLQPRRILDQCFWTAVCSSIHSLPLPWGLI